AGPKTRGPKLCGSKARRRSERLGTNPAAPPGTPRRRNTHTAASSKVPASMRKPAQLRVSLRRTLKPGALFTVASFTSGAGCCVDAVADAGHGGDDPGFAEPFAQCRDRDAHGVGEGGGVVIPLPLQELFGADDTAFGSDEDFEHGEL